MSELANFNRAQMVIQAYNMQNLGKKIWDRRAGYKNIKL